LQIFRTRIWSGSHRGRLLLRERGSGPEESRKQAQERFRSRDQLLPLRAALGVLTVG